MEVSHTKQCYKCYTFLLAMKSSLNGMILSLQTMNSSFRLKYIILSFLWFRPPANVNMNGKQCSNLDAVCKLLQCFGSDGFHGRDERRKLVLGASSSALRVKGGHEFQVD